MRIVIFSGGTGSIALQRGLYDNLDAQLDGVDTKIIVNAYDNGRSTGSVRRVMQGRILGPSDVRKNQQTRLQLKAVNSPWVKFLNCRFTADSSNVEKVCQHSVLKLIDDLDKEGCHRPEYRGVLLNAIEEYFSHPLSRDVDYSEFSLANIIYAGLATANGNSLRAAAKIMAEAMGIPDNVLLNDDKSLFLGAITRSGRRVPDEGDIISWGQETDPFAEVFFTDVQGNTAYPQLCPEASRAILEADMVILSSGTQWSSLIPTYASAGFRAAIDNTKGKILMVMNRTPDRDSPGQTGSDLLDVLVPRYFSTGQLHVISDSNGHPNMRELSERALSMLASFTKTELSTPDNAPDKHDSTKLFQAVGRVYFAEHLDRDFYLFDYDDTLVGRENAWPKSSAFNRIGISRLNALAGIGLCSGNDINSIDLLVDDVEMGKKYNLSDKPLLVFADGGANQYLYNAREAGGTRGNHFRFMQCICPSALLPTDGQFSAETIMSALERAGVPLWKLSNRGNALVAIRPLNDEDRDWVIAVARRLVYGSEMTVRESGRSTVEICRSTLSKVWALRHLRGRSASLIRITYVGDDFDGGNDQDIERMEGEEAWGLKCLHVSSPAMTAFYISVLTSHLCKYE